MSKKIISILLISLCLLTLGYSSVIGDDYYDINTYDVNIEVGNDNTYHIKETIQVQFKADRHGIYRDIDTFQDGYNHRISDIKVYDNSGNDYNFENFREGDLYRIKIGDKNTYVNGTMTYIIEYVYHGSMDYNTLQDEFYFNIIGDQWDAYIQQVSFNIHMPHPFNPETVFFTTGLTNNTNNDHVSFEIKDKTISGYTNKPLEPYMGITIAMPLEEGYYTAVEPPFDIKPAIFGLLIFIILGAMAFIIKFNQSNSKSIEPAYGSDPPLGLNVAEVAYIYNNEMVTSKDVSPLVLQWAGEGYLQIQDDSSKIGPFHMPSNTFIKVRNMDDSKPAYEQNLFNEMFAHGSKGEVSTMDLSQKFYRNINVAIKHIKERFLNEHEILENNIQAYKTIASILYTLIFILCSAYMIHGIMGLPFFSNLIMIAISTVLMLVSIMVSKKMLSQKGCLQKIGTIMFLIFFDGVFLIVLLSELFTVLNPLLHVRQGFGFIGILYVLIFIFGFVQIQQTIRYTEYGLQLYGGVIGFKTFIEEAKLEELKTAYSENPSYFYDILPFAIVFDLTDIWEQHLNKMDLYTTSPDWYRSTHPFSAHQFNESITRSISSASSSPSSSSSSSGGSSGGGGGGGGGGSW